MAPANLHLSRRWSSLPGSWCFGIALWDFDLNLISWINYTVHMAHNFRLQESRSKVLLDQMRIDQVHDNRNGQGILSLGGFRVVGFHPPHLSCRVIPEMISFLCLGQQLGWEGGATQWPLWTWCHGVLGFGWWLHGLCWEW